MPRKTQQNSKRISKVIYPRLTIFYIILHNNDNKKSHSESRLVSKRESSIFVVLDSFFTKLFSHRSSFVVLTGMYKDWIELRNIILNETAGSKLSLETCLRSLSVAFNFLLMKFSENVAFIFWLRRAYSKLERRSITFGLTISLVYHRPL